MDPQPPSDWMASVTRPLRDNPELELAARLELAERAASAEPDQLGALAERFDAIDQTSRRKRTLLHWLPIALAFLVTLGLGIPTALYYRTMARTITTVSGGLVLPGSHGPPAAPPRSKLTPEQHLFLFGDTNQPTEELAAKALWESQPDNPALFADYAARCDPLPADFLETARRIDPDNGWFLLLAAGELAENAIERQQRPFPGHWKDRPQVADWKITDPVKFQRALELLREALTKPRIEYYGGQLLRQRLEILPPERDFPSRVARLAYTANSTTGDVFKVLHASKILTARAFLLGEENDADALRDLLPTTESFCQRIADQEGYLVLQLVALAASRATYEHLVEACERTDMTTESERLRPTLTRIRTIRESHRNTDNSEIDLFMKHGEMLTAMTAPLMGNFGVTSPTAEEMKPGRLMNYALLDRVFLWAAALLLLAGIVAALVLPLLRGSLSSRLGRRIAQLPGPADRLWIFGLGTVTPLAWLLAVTRLTPLGCRDWGLGFFLFQPAATQYGATFFLIIAATACATRWRLGKHAGPLGFAARRPLGSLLPAAALALAIPLAGLIRFIPAKSPLVAALALGSAAILWLLFLAARAVFGKRRHAPYRAAVATLLAPALALGALFLLALTPLTHHAERHWIARDTLMRTSPENLGMGSLEAMAVQTIQSRLQAALNATD